MLRTNHRFNSALCGLIILAWLGAPVLAEASKPEALKLSGAKNRVLPPEQRKQVLAAAEYYLAVVDSDFSAQVEDLINPFVFEQPVEVTEEMMAEAEEEVVVEVVYDDASVLRVVGASFATQVRGTLSRGSNVFLQLSGGGLLGEGSTFPARVPQVEDKSFEVTLFRVTDRDYTLRLGSAQQTFPIGGSRAEGTGATRFTE